MKGLWNFYSFGSLPWVRLLVQKHYRFRSPASVSSPPAGCCPIWKGILSTISPFHVSVLFSLGNGSSAAFWSTRWSGVYLLQNLFPKLYAATNSKQLSVKNWIHRFAATANLGFGLTQSRQDQHDVGQIRNLIERVLLNEEMDQISWRWSRTGKFTVSSAYNFITYDGVDDRKITHLWLIKIPLRIKVFLWLAGRNRLLTAEFFAKRCWYGPSICVLCSADVETLDHILFRCPFARHMWDQTLLNFPRIRHRLSFDTGDISSIWRRARMSVPGQQHGLFDIWFAAACWELWNERNKRIFENILTSSDECGRRTCSTAMFWSLALGA